MTSLSYDPRGFARAHDALGATAPLTFEQEFPLLGIPLRVRSNARRAIELAAESFSAWRSLDPTLIARDIRVEMRVIVHDSPESNGAHEANGAGMDSHDDAAFVYRRHGPVLAASCGSTLLTIDLDRRLYVAFVPAAALDRPEWYAWHINGMARFAVSPNDRHPFHAATFVIDHTAVMVTGPTGGGKSTLAYAALRQRYALLCEEATHVSLANGLSLWGDADRISLAADAVTFFPELAAWPVRALPGGRMKRAYPVTLVQRQPPLCHRGPVMLCVLTRPRAGPSIVESPIIEPPIIEPLSSLEREAALSSDLEDGFDQFPDAHARLVKAFAHVPAWRLTVGSDPDDAVRTLATMARAGG
jgi:hypothetical protein